MLVTSMPVRNGRSALNGGCAARAADAATTPKIGHHARTAHAIINLPGTLYQNRTYRDETCHPRDDAGIRLRWRIVGVPVGTVLRIQQGSVRPLRLSGASHVAFRHLLLRGRGRGDEDCGPARGALVWTSIARARAYPHRASADCVVRQ